MIVSELLESKFKVVVVDDGSGLEYKKYFDKLNTKVISYPQNRGKGYALKKGLEYIKENYDKYIVVTMDSDGQHTVEDAIKLCKYVEKNPTLLVLGSRKRDETVPLRSYLGNTITRVVYNIVSNVDIYDTQTGLRCFSEVLTNDMLEIRGDRYEYEMNVLLEANMRNIVIKEIEIKTIYFDNNKKSHFNTIKDSFKIYKEIIKFASSSIFSFLIDYLLYTLFIIMTSSLIFSNISSRIISSFVNYNINKKIVFNSDSKNSFFKYYILVVIILILNTLLLSILSSIINIFVSKIITEIVLFIISLLVQKKLIFKGSGKDKKIYT